MGLQELEEHSLAEENEFAQIVVPLLANPSAQAGEEEFGVGDPLPDRNTQPDEVAEGVVANG